jgi:hypothetical protein
MALASVAATLVGTKAQANTTQIVRLSKIKVGGTFPRPEFLRIKQFVRTKVG